MTTSSLRLRALLAGCVAIAACSQATELPRFQYNQNANIADRTASTSHYLVLYSFGAFYGDGSAPLAGLIDVQDKLYGTTWQGGRYSGGTYSHGGTVFSVTTGGVENVLHNFKGGYQKHPDGSQPDAPLIDVNDTLYGTTSHGGKYLGYGRYFGGIVFSITMSGTEKTLHSFGNDADGAIPSAGLIDARGTLYGTTYIGGAYGLGTVFSITTDGAEKVLYSFKGGADGQNPLAPLIDVNGTLYGTTVEGGAYGYGTVFSLTISGTEQVLHSFGRGSDGAYPLGGLLRVGGTLYGTTGGGGATGGGTVFSITTGGTEKVLHSFGTGSDGAVPLAGLVSVKGMLYGTTEHGGVYPKHSYGTIFRITTDGTEQVVYNFGSGCRCGDYGFNPAAPLINVRGTLYGTSHFGGVPDGGVVFAFTP